MKKEEELENQIITLQAGIIGIAESLRLEDELFKALQLSGHDCARHLIKAILDSQKDQVKTNPEDEDATIRMLVEVPDATRRKMPQGDFFYRERSAASKYWHQGEVQKTAGNLLCIIPPIDDLFDGQNHLGIWYDIYDIEIREHDIVECDEEE